MELSDKAWKIVEPLLLELSTGQRGRPWRGNREVLDAILWVLRTGVPWRDLPKKYPPYQTCHRRFQKWSTDGTLEKVLKAVADKLHKRHQLNLSECYIDAKFIAAEKGGACVGKTKCGKGAKLVAITEKRGGPVGVLMASASRPEVRLVELALDACFVSAAPNASLTSCKTKRLLACFSLTPQLFNGILSIGIRSYQQKMVLGRVPFFDRPHNISPYILLTNMLHI